MLAGIFPTDYLWRGALAAIPLALVVAAVCRWGGVRPATRHGLWAMVLVFMVVAPALPSIRLSSFATTSSEIGASGADGEALDRKQDTQEKGDSRLLNIDNSMLASSSDRRCVSTEKPYEREPIVREPDLSVAGQPGPDHKEVRHRVPSSNEPLQEAFPTGPNVPNTLARVCTPTESLLHFDTAGVLAVQDDTGEGPLGPESSEAEASGGGSEFLPQPSSPVPLSPVEIDNYVDAYVGATTTAMREWLVDRAATGDLSSKPIATIPVYEPGVEQIAESAKVEDSSDGYRDSCEESASASEVDLPASGGFASYLSGLERIREAIGSLPPLPPSLWLAGVGVCLALWMVSLLRLSRNLRRSHPAPKQVESLVSQIAREMGLGTVPVVRVASGMFSPMVCGLVRPKLVLPEELWDELDGASRKAVVCHELAHLKRRDNWVRCIDSIIGTVYWWHPLVWWVRNHLHDEAEHACDAWVTWVFPRGRRAYAEALLTAQQYVEGSFAPKSVGGIGMARGRARRFGRRLTMIMTGTIKPKLSSSGIALALVLAIGGLGAMPAQSGDPKVKVAVKPGSASSIVIATSGGTCSKVTSDKCSTSCSKASAGTSCATSSKSVTSCSSSAKAGTADCSKSCAKSCSKSAPAASTYKQYLAAKGGGNSDKRYFVLASDSDESLDSRLEARLAELEAKLDMFAKRMEQVASAIEVPAIHLEAAHSLAEIAKLPEMAESLEMAEAPDLPFFVPSESQPHARVPVVLGSEYFAASATEAREYHLPQPQLDALAELMVRQDVPILVTPQEDSIVVHATPQQHVAFGNFVKMITAKEEIVKPYKLESGKLEALTDLMRLNEVPVLVSGGDGAIEVHGNSLQHDVFEAFVQLLTDKPGEPRLTRVPRASTPNFLKREIEKKACKERKVKKQLKQKKNSSHPKHPFGVSSDDEHFDHARLETALKMHEHSEKLQEALEQSNAAYRVARGQHASDVRTIQIQGMQEQVSKLQLQIMDLESAADAVEAEAEMLMMKAEELELHAQEIEERADYLRDAAEDEESASKRYVLAQKVREMEKEYRGVANEARRLEREAENKERYFENLEEQIERIEDVIESLNDAIEGIMRVKIEESEEA